MARMKVTSVGQRTADQTPDGRVIIAREHNAQAPHPAPSQNGRPVPTQGINKILVQSHDDADHPDDGVELYECDQCGWTNVKAASVVSHLPSHNPSRSEPDYDVRTIRMVVSIVDKYKAAGVRGYCEKAAEELNTLQVPTHKGGPWTQGAVSSVYNRWKNDPLVKRRTTARREKTGDTEKAAALRNASPRSPKRTVASPVSPQSPLAAVTDADHPIVQKLAELAAGIGDVALQLAKVTQELAALPIGENTSAELREKAAKYDQLAGLLRG